MTRLLVSRAPPRSTHTLAAWTIPTTRHTPRGTPTIQDSRTHALGLVGRRTGLTISAASLKVDSDGFDNLEAFWDSEKSSSVDSPAVGRASSRLRVLSHTSGVQTRVTTLVPSP